MRTLHDASCQSTVAPRAYEGGGCAGGRLMGQVVRAMVQWAGVSLPVSLTSYSVVRCLLYIPTSTPSLSLLNTPAPVLPAARTRCSSASHPQSAACRCQVSCTRIICGWRLISFAVLPVVSFQWHWVSDQ